MQTDQKSIWRFSLFYDIFFKIIFQMLAVVEAPFIFLFESLVKQMFFVIAEAAPHSCSSRKIIWSIPVINVKRNNFINNGQKSWRYFYFPNACCSWSTVHIFIWIFSQTNVLCNCRSSPPQLFFKKDYLIYTRYKCEEEQLHK